MDVQDDGKSGSSKYVGRGLDGTLSFVPLLPPRKCELELATNDGRIWAISNLNLLAPFSTKMWKMLASMTNEEIEECKRRALLANSPTKRTLTRTWDMHRFSTGNYDCQKDVIVRTKILRLVWSRTRTIMASSLTDIGHSSNMIVFHQSKRRNVVTLRWFGLIKAFGICWLTWEHSSMKWVSLPNLWPSFTFWHKKQKILF